MRRARTAFVGIAVTTALAAGALFGGVLTEAGSTPAAVPAPSSRAIADQALAGIGRPGTAAAVERLERAVAAQPRDADSLGALGLAYQLRWRETGDASYLPRADRALARALAARPGDATAVLGLGSLALIQHEFRRALRLGQKAARLSPSSARPLGVIGDALVELGRYPEAFRAFERMTALKPNLSSYARIAYARELTGDPQGRDLGHAARPRRGRRRARADGLGARRAREARAGAGPPAQGRAACPRSADRAPRLRVRARAAGAHRGGERQAPPVPSWRRVAQPRRSRCHSSSACSAISSSAPAAGPRHAGRGRRWRRSSACWERTGSVSTSSLRCTAPTTASAPPRRSPSHGRARAERPSIYGDDALGWALARAGRCDEALPWLRRALRLGTQDALAVLPPRLRGGLRRQQRCQARLVPEGARPQSSLLGALVGGGAGGSGVKRIVATLAVVAVAALASVGSAAAHPLGNFTVNHYAGIEVSGDTIYVRVALDLAEIPTFQTGDRVRSPGYAAALARELELSVDGRRSAVAGARAPCHRASGRGWVEDACVWTRSTRHGPADGSSSFATGPTARGSGGGRSRSRPATARGVESSSVPARSSSDALRSYPQEHAQLAARRAIGRRAVVDLGDGPGVRAVDRGSRGPGALGRRASRR